MLNRVKGNKEWGKRTCDEGTPKFDTSVHEGENGVFGQPVLVAVEFVVPKCKKLHLEASKHQLDAIQRGIPQAERGNEVPEDCRIAYGDPPRWNRSGWFVHLVFLWRLDLVREVEL